MDKDEECSLAYPSLSDDQNQIRLLTIDFVDGLGSIHCSLAAVSLDAYPKYVALSYVWGDDEATQTISVNGSPFRIRSNLHEFFNIVAAKELIGARLFVDAISINQSNVNERIAQVTLMKRIYGEAERVVAWLGTADDMFTNHPFADASRILAVANDIIDQETKALVPNFDEIVNIANEEDDMEQESIEEKIIRLSDHEDLADPRKRTQILEKFKDLKRKADHVHYATFQFSYRRPFWERVWIIQEVILARKLTIQVGEYSCSPESYLAGALQDVEPSKLNIDAMVLLGAPTNLIRREIRIHDLVSRRAEWHERLYNGPPIKLYEVLTRFNQQKSSEPLDQIFGFLGLAESAVKPDYTLTPIELYTYVFIEGIRELYDVPVIRQELNAPWTFYHACLSAFQFSASDPAIALIANNALSLCGIPWRMRFLVLTHGILASDADLIRDGNLHDTGGYREFQILKTISMTFYRIVCAFISCAWLFIRIQHLKIRDALVPGPVGDVRSYSEWITFVQNTAWLVRNKLPPRSAIPSEDSDTGEKGALNSLPTVPKILIILILKIIFYLVVKPLARLTGRKDDEILRKVLVTMIRFALRLLRLIVLPWILLRRLWLKLHSKQVEMRGRDSTQ